VKVLIDEDVAEPFVAMLVHLLPAHEITSVRACGWSGKKDVPPVRRRRAPGIRRTSVG
jgi:hypothetical protein